VVVVELKAALVALFPLAPQISCLVDSLPSSIMVESFHLLYGGLCLSTTSIPTPSDLSRVKTFMCTLVPKGFSVRCKVPSSWSFCKLIGVLFLCGGNPINLKDASLILAFSVYKDNICLATPPRIVCDSRWADTVTATPKPASSMAHSTVTRALELWAHTWKQTIKEWNEIVLTLESHTG